MDEGEEARKLTFEQAWPNIETLAASAIARGHDPVDLIVVVSDENNMRARDRVDVSQALEKSDPVRSREYLSPAPVGHFRIAVVSGGGRSTVFVRPAPRATAGTN